MCKVVSTVSKQRFELYKVDFPKGWEVVFVNFPYSEEELITACDGADFLFVNSVHPVTKNVIVNIPSVKMIHVEGVGFDKVDIGAAKEAGIPVCNNRAVNNCSVAEHTIGLMIAGLRRITLADSELKQREFSEVQNEFRAQGVHELSSMHVGLIGIGAIGQELVKLLKPFGCKVSYYDAFRPTPEREKELGVSFLELNELLKECDVISLHVPVLPSTINMISKKELEMMKNTALLINTARGELIDQPALAEALETGKIYGAAVDTISPEPAPKDHPLLTMSKKAAAGFIITPHIGGTTDEAFTRMLKWAIDDMKLVIEGSRPKNIVNGI